MNQDLVTFLFDMVAVDQPGGMVAAINKANGHGFAAIHIGLGAVPLPPSRLSLTPGRGVMMQVNMIYAVSTKDVYEKVMGKPYDRQECEHVVVEGVRVGDIMGRQG